MSENRSDPLSSRCSQQRVTLRLQRPVLTWLRPILLKAVGGREEAQPLRRRIRVGEQNRGGVGHRQQGGPVGQIGGSLDHEVLPRIQIQPPVYGELHFRPQWEAETSRCSGSANGNAPDWQSVGPAVPTPSCGVSPAKAWPNNCRLSSFFRPTGINHSRRQANLAITMAGHGLSCLWLAQTRPSGARCCREDPYQTQQRCQPFPLKFGSCKAWLSGGIISVGWPGSCPRRALPCEKFHARQRRQLAHHRQEPHSAAPDGHQPGARVCATSRRASIPASPALASGAARPGPPHHAGRGQALCRERASPACDRHPMPAR